MKQNVMLQERKGEDKRFLQKNLEAVSHSNYTKQDIQASFISNGHLEMNEQGKHFIPKIFLRDCLRNTEIVKEY